jgi:hypothetical protein
MAETAMMTASPQPWPKRSLIVLKRSTSKMTSDALPSVF